MGKQSDTASNLRLLGSWLIPNLRMHTHLEPDKEEKP